MTQIKTSVTSKRANQGLLDDNELMARRLDALPSEYVTIADHEASTVDDPSRRSTRRSNAAASFALLSDLGIFEVKKKKDVK